MHKLNAITQHIFHKIYKNSWLVVPVLNVLFCFFKCFLYNTTAESMHETILVRENASGDLFSIFEALFNNKKLRHPLLKCGNIFHGCFRFSNA